MPTALERASCLQRHSPAVTNSPAGVPSSHELAPRHSRSGGYVADGGWSVLRPSTRDQRDESRCFDCGSEGLSLAT
jgi:hypothetical protein